MPWIVVTTPALVEPEQADALAVSVAAAAADALDLSTRDIIVLVQAAVAAAGAGAYVVVSGRARTPDAEESLATAVKTTVAQALSVSPEHVGLTRSTT
ncbi:MAG: hypothetical protein LCH77_01740 [Actinobacteria bacterium]|nr:hypothetical protein [Actinomycetota bacterium]